MKMAKRIPKTAVPEQIRTKIKASSLDRFCEVYIPQAPSVFTYGVPADLPEGVEIRRAAPEDIPAAAGLAAELWPHHPVEEFMEEFTSLLADNGRGLFLAFADGVPAGFAECSLRHDYVEGTESSPVGYLEGIYVKETVRHRGIARSLLSACEAWARKKGCSEFASDCELTNIESQGFHRAVGFTEANRLVAYVRKL